jgi:hypothetical protein
MIRQSSRWIWIVVLLSIWLTAFLIPWETLPSMPCPIKSTMGIPCPTCGGTRAIIALKQLHLHNALLWNPLVTVGIIVSGIWGALMTAFPAFPTPDQAKKHLRIPLVIGIAITMVYLLIFSV